jgi:putative Mn2+ efflux pump MntP
MEWYQWVGVALFFGFGIWAIASELNKHNQWWKDHYN